MNFVVFSDDWGRHQSSCQHLFRQILNEHSVVWVNTIGMRRPTLSVRDMNRALEKIRGWMAPADGSDGSAAQLPKNLSVISPMMTPYHGLPGGRWFNTRQVVNSVRTELSRRGMTDPILVTTVPNMVDAIGSMDERLVVYYCVDDFTEWHGMDRDLLLGMESRLVEHSDVVIATAKRLAESRVPPSGRVHLLPHGVDIEHFRQAAHRHEVNAAVEHLPHPLLGFFGLIDERVDFELVAAIARRRPEWHWLFVGERAVKPKDLDALPNIHWTGRVTYNELPSYASAFSVCVLPYVRNELTDHINPLKLREYLATGKPVVATKLPEAVALEDYLWAADGVDEFIRSIEEALDHSTDEERWENLEGQGWPEKAHEFVRWVIERLAEQYPAEARVG